MIVESNSFTTRELKLSDADALALSLKPQDTHISSGHITVKTGQDTEITINGAMRAKIRPNTKVPASTNLPIPSGDTAHAAVIENDLFVATVICVTDGLSSASPLWQGRTKQLKGLLKDVGKSLESRSIIESLPWEQPDLASAQIINGYYQNPSWILTLDQVAKDLTAALLEDRLIRGNSRHPYPFLELESPKLVKDTVLSLAQYRNELLSDMPYYFQLLVPEGDLADIPYNIFNWYLNAIFTHSLVVVPKKFPKINDSRVIIGSSVTSNADTTDILMSQSTRLKHLLYEEQFLRLQDPNRQVEHMINRIAQQRDSSPQENERLLLSKPQNIYMTYPANAFLGWLRNFDTISTTWTEVARPFHSAPSMMQGGITDGAIYPTRDLDREMSNRDFAARVNLLLVNTSMILDQDATDDQTNLVANSSIHNT